MVFCHYPAKGAAGRWLAIIRLRVSPKWPKVRCDCPRGTEAVPKSKFFVCLKAVHAYMLAALLTCPMTEADFSPDLRWSRERHCSQCGL